jgi:hypothetical protein
MFYKAHIGSATDKAVSHQLLTTEAQVFFPGQSMLNLWGQSGTGIVFSPSFLVFPVNIILLLLHIHISGGWT